MENRNSKAPSRLYVSIALLMVAILAVTVITLINGIARRNEAPRTEETSGETASTETKASPQRGTDVPETRSPVMLLPDNTETKGETEAVTKAPETAAPTVEQKEEEPSTQTSAPLTFMQPVAGYVVKFHDLDMPVYSFTMEDWRVHRGIDIAATLGSEVKACAAGVIASVGNDPMMGETVIIDHGNGLMSIYRNLSSEHPAEIVEGARVEAGQCIGGIGESALVEISDASHLHFEMKLGGIDVDPLEYVMYDVVVEE
ncbi:MAG: M23 family metallopeptidase [Clostridia bacterium]|nr:M23 family metallopeptidase [Clostridia bacterium]